MSAIGDTIGEIIVSVRAGVMPPHWTVPAKRFAQIRAELEGAGFPLCVAVPGHGILLWGDDPSDPPNIVLRNVPVLSMESLAS